MKKIVTALLLGMFHLAHAQQSFVIRENAKEAGFAGAIKSILERRVIISEDSSRRYTTYEYIEYNKAGNEVLRKSKTNMYKEKYSSITSTYDEAQNLREVSYYEDTLRTERRVSEYDSQNRKATDLTYAQNGMQREKTVYSYDASGYVVEEILWGFGDYFISKYVYTYDKNGNQLSKKSYDRKDVLTFESLYQYDKNNNKTEQKNRLSNGTVRTTRYTYNEKNELIKYVFYENDRIINECNYTYQNGVITETVVYSPGDQSKTISRSNEKGLPIERVEYKNDQVVRRQTWWYEYDAAGNWIKEYNSYNGDSPSITEREIHYH